MYVCLTIQIEDQYNLFLLPVGPVIKTQPRTEYAREGTTVLFTCMAESNPPPTYTWTRGLTTVVRLVYLTETLTLETQFQVGNSPNLTVVASKHNSGDYFCHALLEGFLTSTSQPASLLLITKPLVNTRKVC